MGRERPNDTGFTQPSQAGSFSHPPQRWCKLDAIVCLGRLLQGGAPLLVFVQPVRELLGHLISHWSFSHLLPWL